MIIKLLASLFFLGACSAGKTSELSDSPGAPVYYRYNGSVCVDSQGRQGYNQTGTECVKLRSAPSGTLTGNWRGSDFGTVFLSGKMQNIDLSGANLSRARFAGGFEVSIAKIDQRTNFPQCRAQVVGATIRQCFPR
jgi:hypothetical protein